MFSNVRSGLTPNNNLTNFDPGLFTPYSKWGVDNPRTLIFFKLTVAVNCRSLRHSVLKARPYKLLPPPVVWRTNLLAFIVPLLPARKAFQATTSILVELTITALIHLFVLVLLGMMKGTVRGKAVNMWLLFGELTSVSLG
jgi:hypothetical protein